MGGEGGARARGRGCVEVFSRAVGRKMPRSPEMRGVLPSVGITRARAMGRGGGVHLCQRAGEEGQGYCQRARACVG